MKVQVVVAADLIVADWIKLNWTETNLIRWISVCQLSDLISWLIEDILLVQVERHLTGKDRQHLQSGQNKWFGTMLESNRRRGWWWRPQQLAKVQDYRIREYDPPPPTSAFHPAVVAQMCSPITHLYPSSSLQVIDGKLAPYLSKVIKFASSHVFSCSLCREKGFICELCHNGQVIYPFQESAIKRYSSSHT